MIDFKSLYTNIPVEAAVHLMKELMFKFQNIIPNAHVVLELLDLVLKNSLMQINGEYFQQFFGIIIGANVAPILENSYSAILEQELEIIRKAKT